VIVISTKKPSHKHSINHGTAVSNILVFEEMSWAGENLKAMFWECNCLNIPELKIVKLAWYHIT